MSLRYKEKVDCWDAAAGTHLFPCYSREDRRDKSRQGCACAHAQTLCAFICRICVSACRRYPHICTSVCAVFVWDRRGDVLVPWSVFLSSSHKANFLWHYVNRALTTSLTVDPVLVNAAPKYFIDSFCLTSTDTNYKGSLYMLLVYAWNKEKINLVEKINFFFSCLTIQTVLHNTQESLQVLHLVRHRQKNLLDLICFINIRIIETVLGDDLDNFLSADLFEN